MLSNIHNLHINTYIKSNENIKNTTAATNPSHNTNTTRQTDKKVGILTRKRTVSNECDGPERNRRT